MTHTKKISLREIAKAPAVNPLSASMLLSLLLGDAIALDEATDDQRKEMASTVPASIRVEASEAMLRREDDLRNLAQAFDRMADVARDFAILVSGVSADFRKG